MKSIMSQISFCLLITVVLSLVPGAVNAQESESLAKKSQRGRKESQAVNIAWPVVPIESAVVNIVLSPCIEVIEITARSGKSDNSPQVFEGHLPFPFDPDVSFPGNPGEHLVVFFRDVLVDETNPQVLEPFTIDLMASVQPAGLNPSILNESWVLSTAPPGTSPSILSKTGTFNAEIRNPPRGGLYKITYSPVMDVTESEVNIVLPLAGAEVKDIVKADLDRADIFAERVRDRYPLGVAIPPFNPIPGQQYTLADLFRWFYTHGAGDYLGRPNNSNSPTVRVYNQVQSDPNHVKFGMGAVATWFGVPIRVAKISNFVVGYTMAKMGVPDIVLLHATLLGHLDDKAAEKSFFAGVALARQEGITSYDEVRYTIIDIFDEVDDEKDKHMKLWPNPFEVTNHYPFQSGFWDPDTQFTSPGFLEPGFPL